MARSVWKGPFVDQYILKKAEAARASGRKDVIKIWSRRSTILPQFVGLNEPDNLPALKLLSHQINLAKDINLLVKL